MTHEISVLGCGAIYIDNERVFGSKPYGLFSTVNWSATDEDLKRIADRCLELIADRKTEPTISKMEQVEDEPKTQMKTQNSNLTFENSDEPQNEVRRCMTCKYNPWVSKACREYKGGVCDNYEPQTERSE